MSATISVAAPGWCNWQHMGLWSLESWFESKPRSHSGGWHTPSLSEPPQTSRWGLPVAATPWQRAFCAPVRTASTNLAGELSSCSKRAAIGSRIRARRRTPLGPKTSVAWIAVAYRPPTRQSRHHSTPQIIACRLIAGKILVNQGVRPVACGKVANLWKSRNSLPGGRSAPAAEFPPLRLRGTHRHAAAKPPRRPLRRAGGRPWRIMNIGS